MLFRWILDLAHDLDLNLDLNLDLPSEASFGKDPLDALAWRLTALVAMP